MTAVRLPGDVLRDTWLVYGALARMLLRRERPDGGFAEIPVAGPAAGPGAGPGADTGADTPLGQTSRVLLTWARSLAPNSFVLGIDPEHDVMLVHRLVAPAGGKQ